MQLCRKRKQLPFDISRKIINLTYGFNRCHRCRTVYTHEGFLHHGDYCDYCMYRQDSPIPLGISIWDPQFDMCTSYEFGIERWFLRFSYEKLRRSVFYYDFDAMFPHGHTPNYPVPEPAISPYPMYNVTTYDHYLYYKIILCFID